MAPDGSYALPPQTLTQNTVFKVRLGRHGAHVAVKVSPLVTLSVSPLSTPSTRANGAARLTQRSRASFTGTVTPAGGSGRVALQVQYPADGEAWRTIAFAQIQPDGSYSLAHGFKIGGEASVRVIAHLRGTNAPGVSEVVAYAIPQAQNLLGDDIEIDLRRPAFNGIAFGTQPGAGLLQFAVGEALAFPAEALQAHGLDQQLVAFNAEGRAGVFDDRGRRRRPAGLGFLGQALLGEHEALRGHLVGRDAGAQVAIGQAPGLIQPDELHGYFGEITR